MKTLKKNIDFLETAGEEINEEPERIYIHTVSEEGIIKFDKPVKLNKVYIRRHDYKLYKEKNHGIKNKLLL